LRAYQASVCTEASSAEGPVGGHRAARLDSGGVGRADMTAGPANLTAGPRRFPATLYLGKNSA